MLNRLKTHVLAARMELDEHVQPRDDFERAVINALGEISWDEAVTAILKHRATLPTPAEPR